MARALPQRDLAANRRGTGGTRQPFERPRLRFGQVLRRMCRAVCTFGWYLLVLAPIRPPWANSRLSSGPVWRRAVARLVLAVVAVSSVAMPGGAVGFAVTARLFNAVRLAPVTAPAVVWGLANGGRLDWTHGMPVVSGMHAGFGPRDGVTVGSVYLTGSPREALTARMIGHEREHITQWSAFGLLFPPIYWAAGRAGQLVDLGDGAAGNVFEIAAGLRAGGYLETNPSHLDRAGRGWRTDLIGWLDPRSDPPGVPQPANRSAVSPPTRSPTSSDWQAARWCHV